VSEGRLCCLGAILLDSLNPFANIQLSSFDLLRMLERRLLSGVCSSIEDNNQFVADRVKQFLRGHLLTTAPL